MGSVTSALRTLRYFDRLIIQGKRMVVGVDHNDPCTYIGHGEVLGFLVVYCNDAAVTEDEFVWTVKTVTDLEHISQCVHCIARVFSVPDRDLGQEIHRVVAQAS